MAKKVEMEFDVFVGKRIEINEIPDRWVEWFEAWDACDDERTDEQWDLLERHTWEEVLSDITGEDINEASLWSY